MKKSKVRKIALGRETIRILADERDLFDINGGRLCSTPTVGTVNTIQRICTTTCPAEPSSPTACGPTTGGA